MHENGKRADRRHAFIKLIVRACPRHKWGPPDCTGDCEYCYNGGVCDDKTGICICAPGFKGPTCENECGANTHGWNCENRCTSRNLDYACRNYQFCLPDPYGCSCVSGFKGISCEAECPPGTFGADCAQTCHCNRRCCDRYTGRCTSIEDSSCTFPWAGSNCQKCQPKFYGENCDMECNNVCNECERLTGNCITCSSSYLEPDCKIGILNTKFITANNGQNTSVSCSVYHTDAYKVQTMIIVMNNDVTENITTALEAKQDGQNIMIYTFSVIADVDSTYNCVISHEGVLAQSVIIPEIFRVPVYIGNLTVLNISSSFITIEWTEWNNNTDDGDGPVVGYFLYHKLSNTTDWKKGLYQNNTSGTVNGLMWDTEYTFAVSAVRPGEGGEGPIGEKELRTKTQCGRPFPVQKVEHWVLTNGSFEVSWIKNLEFQPLKCPSKTLMYNVYLKVISNEEYHEKVYHTNNTQPTIDDIDVVDSYVILVTVSNKDSESMSVGSPNKQENVSENVNTSVFKSPSLIGGAVAAGVCIGTLFTIMITQCNTQRKNSSKSDENSSNELQAYQDYANDGNTSYYKTCISSNQESDYELPDLDENDYVNELNAQEPKTEVN
ncbi:angiopoietin-1 receptor-like [Antedon mediterranea]|uniref:angiopoietin-1 receptor-like n=1 Tax=Antedon mediterranea TaxID=105859 RepID=UPI003AF9BE81